MEPFLYGFVLSTILLIVILLVLRITIPYFPRLFVPRPAKFNYVTESTEWLNFIFNRVISHFQDENFIKEINEIVSTKMLPNQFRLISLGNAPSIKYVATLEMQEADDIRLLIPIDWQNGPSLDLLLPTKAVNIELDVICFSGQVLVSWPGNSQNKVEIKFIGDLAINFNLTLQLFNFIHFSVTNIPLVGEIIKGIVSFMLEKKAVYVNLPKPAIIPETSASD